MSNTINLIIDGKTITEAKQNRSFFVLNIAVTKKIIAIMEIGLIAIIN